MDHKEIHALIIGTGITGIRHLQAQLKEKVSCSVYSPNPHKLTKLKSKYNIEVFNSLNQALEWSNLVHLCTPDNTHTEIAEKVIGAGKNIFCEKPITTSLKDALHLQNLVKKYKTTFIVCNNYRLTPTFLETKKRVDKGKIGKLIEIRTTYLHDMRSYFKKTPWRIYQDFLYGGGIHAIDLAVWIANEPVIKAYASTGIKLIPKYKHPEDYHINLFFKSGMQACVWVNARVVLPIHKSELEVYGEKGTLLSENKSGTLLSYKYKQAKRDYQREYLGTGYRSTLNTGVKIVNEYITGISKTHYPLPDINEAVEILKVVDMIDNLLKENH